MHKVHFECGLFDCLAEMMAFTRGPQPFGRTSQKFSNRICNLGTRCPLKFVPTSVIIPKAANQGDDQPAVVEYATASAACTSVPAFIEMFQPLLDSPPTAVHEEMATLLDQLKPELLVSSTEQIASLAWLLSELGFQPKSSWVDEFYSVVGSKLDMFLAPDLCRLVCAISSFEAKPNSPTLQTILNEAEYQLKEYTNDFTAFDVARLITGCGQLGIVSDLLMEGLEKAIYLKVKTIEERAAVDYALTQIDSGVRSIKFDTKWDFEGLHWLPRHERDKRRIIKDNWYRTQWQGWKS